MEDKRRRIRQREKQKKEEERGTTGGGGAWKKVRRMKDGEKNKGEVLNKQNGWKKDKRTMLGNNTTREGGRSEETMARETV